jgi:hypothetical protein
MKTAEVFFLAAVLFFAVVFAGLSLSRGARSLGSLVAEEAVVGGAAGKPRDVDLERIREMIRQGRLSDREADFYEEDGGTGGEAPRER